MSHNGNPPTLTDREQRAVNSAARLLDGRHHEVHRTDDGQLRVTGQMYGHPVAFEQLGRDIVGWREVDPTH